MHENQKHQGKLLYEWLLEQAKRRGIHGGSAFRAIAGFGRHGRLHEQSFFEMAADLTVLVEFVVSMDEADALIALAEEDKAPLFWTRYQVEYGNTVPHAHK
jgi:PII-like signaling protein